ncbi:MAG TPA: STAS/SEC14 domain-containing protein [Acidiferrobacteraceae bacterium]|nr:STAS/SEC14 domain-containing protein [Acidiferrobacteraceae bacterium]HEX20526.1 STAS/SEC14 domain-containing protein [Acidiferrobacteraceae bacterium]
MTTQFSCIEVEGNSWENILTMRLSGKLTKEDYERFVPEIERMMKAHDKVRILVELVDFHGWTAAAAWEDTKFGIRHFNDVERIAIVGDAAWEKGMALLCEPFTVAKVKYFDTSQMAAAKTWIIQGQ